MHRKVKLQKILTALSNQGVQEYPVELLIKVITHNFNVTPSTASRYIKEMTEWKLLSFDYGKNKFINEYKRSD
jgi:DNA-binding IclR family transcriptional regulator